MSAPLRIAPANAIAELAFAIGYETSGHLPVYLDGRPNPSSYLPCNSIVRTGQRLAHLAAAMDLQESAEVAVGLPRIKEFVYSSSILWAWAKGSEQVGLAAKFTPKPSIVLRIGPAASERLLIWVLRQPVTEEKATQLNARISYALHAPRTRSKPEDLRIPLPGTFARVGRSRPAPVLVTRLCVERGHVAEKVAGKLKDPPVNDAWRERQER